MRRALMGICAVLALTGCSDSTPRKAAAAAAPAETATAPREVLLDAQAQSAAGVFVEEVRAHGMPQTIRASGRITANENRTWRVGAVTEGRVMRVYANAGDRVADGQVLARLHSHDIHEARASYRRALSELARFKSMEAHAIRVRNRARRLLELKAASLEQAENAEVEWRSAQTATENANVEVERTRQHLNDFLGIPADIPDADRHDEVDLIPVRSPASGVLISRDVTPGTVVTPSTEMFTVADLSTLWMIAAVNEDSLSQLRVGLPVRVYVQAYPSRGFTGRISRLDEELDPTTRTIKARVELANPGGLLKPEMYATAEIELGESTEAMFVPQGAIQQVDGNNVLFVRVAEDRFEARPVTTGRTIGSSVEITSGLTAGDRVVTRGSFMVKSQFLKSTMPEE